MASLSAISLSADINFIKRPADVQKFSNNVTITQITDHPAIRTVIAHVDGIDPIILDDLSGVNYDTPSEWTNSDVENAVIKYLQINS